MKKLNWRSSDRKGDGTREESRTLLGLRVNHPDWALRTLAQSRLLAIHTTFSAPRNQLDLHRSHSPACFLDWIRSTPRQSYQEFRITEATIGNQKARLVGWVEETRYQFEGYQDVEGGGGLNVRKLT